MAVLPELGASDDGHAVQLPTPPAEPSAVPDMWSWFLWPHSTSQSSATAAAAAATLPTALAAAAEPAAARACCRLVDDFVGRSDSSGGQNHPLAIRTRGQVW